MQRDKMGTKEQSDLIVTDAPCLKISNQLFSFLENSGCLILVSRNSDCAYSQNGFPSSHESHTTASLRSSTCISLDVFQVQSYDIYRTLYLWRTQVVVTKCEQWTNNSSFSHKFCQSLVLSRR